MKLLVINQYYAPDIASTGQLAAEICSSLVKRGFEVHVVTGQPSYTASSPEAPEYEVLDGVHVHRVSLGGAKGRERMRTRLQGYIRFLWGAWKLSRTLAKTKAFDVVLTFHNPPFVGLIGAYLAARYRLRYIYALYDIHPDVLLATGWHLPRPAIWFWEALNRRIFRYAHAIVVLGEGMKQTLVEKKSVSPEKVWIIPPWARPELSPASRDQPIRKELGLSDEELLLLYAGNMGIMHPLDPILDAAALLQELPVCFLFVGEGAKKRYLIERVQKEEIGQVKFLPYQPEDRFVQLVAAADACFVALEPGLEWLAVPSRAFTFLSAGRALITIMAPEAEIAQLVTKTGCGWNVTNGQELADLVRKLLGRRQELIRRGERARAVYEERFRQTRAIEAYIKVLKGEGIV